MFSKMALGAIWGYQNYISPRKGFRCAYSVQNGGTGCSGYAKYAIRDHGLWRALPIIRQRLRDCKAAYADIKASCTCRTGQHAGQHTEQHDNDRPLSADERAELERRRKQDNRCCTKSDMCMGCTECGSAPLSCGGGTAARTAGANKMCDLNPCDGDIGCGTCDACSCDVCSCS